ncbi:cytidylyltransferase domain-containing protein [Propionibacteriaceae bacterium Y2011]
MRTRVVIQSRLNSSRLPGKALLHLAGMPLIELVARRASRSGHEVIVATSDEHYDGRIADHLDAVGIPVLRGPLDDVLGRFVAATADLTDDDMVVRLTGDNPICDADVIDELLGAMVEQGKVYGRNNVDDAPEGIGCEGFPVGLLRRAAREATDPYDREHVTPWIRRAVDELDYVPRQAPRDIFRFRATVDCLDDYDIACRVFDRVADPIGISWIELMERVGRLRTGPMSGRVSHGLSGMSQVVMGRYHPASGVADGTQWRDLARIAVAHGVSHAVVDSGDAGAYRQATDPAVKQRLGVVLVLTEPTSGTALQVELERAFAELGQRRVAWAMVPVGASAEVRAALAEHRRAGRIGDLGEVVTTPAELARVGATGLLAQGAAVVDAVARGGVDWPDGAATRFVRTSDADQVTGLLAGGATSVVVDVTDPEGVVAAVAAR